MELVLYFQQLNTNANELIVHDVRFAIAPKPNYKHLTCKFWAEGNCSKISEHCLYLHGYPEGTEGRLEQNKRPESAPHLGPSAPPPIVPDSTSIPTGRRISIASAIDEPMTFSYDSESYSPSDVTWPTRNVGAGHVAQDPNYSRVDLQEQDSATALTGPRKSVSFALDKPMALSKNSRRDNSPEFAAYQNAVNESVYRDPKYNRVCEFWRKGDCWRGGDCRYLHFEVDGCEQSLGDTRYHKVCKFWLTKDCWDDDKCPYYHSYDGSDKKLKPVAALPPKGPNQYGPEARVRPEPNEQGAPILDTTFPANSRSTKDLHQDHPSREESARKSVSFQAAEDVLGIEAQVKPRYGVDQTRGSNQQQMNAAYPSPIDQYNPEDVPSKPKGAVAKISMDNNYRRNKAIKDLGDGAKEVTFGKDEINSVVADFGNLTPAKQYSWGQTLAALTRIHFTKMCLAQDFKVQLRSLKYQTLWQGSLGLSPNDDEAMKTMDKAGEYLRLSSAGFVAMCQDFTILIYPAATEEWKFLEAAASYSPEMRLRYLVFRTDVDFRYVLSYDHHVGVPVNVLLCSTSSDSEEVSVTSKNYRKTLVESLHGLTFQKFAERKINSKQRYHFFLLFPSTANATADFMTKWLQQSSNQCKIYSSQTEGAWDYFVKNPKVDTGIVLIHESAVASVSFLNRFIGRRTKLTWWR